MRGGSGSGGGHSGPASDRVEDPSPPSDPPPSGGAGASPSSAAGTAPAAAASEISSLKQIVEDAVKAGNASLKQELKLELNQTIKDTNEALKLELNQTINQRMDLSESRLNVRLDGIKESLDSKNRSLEGSLEGSVSVQLRARAAAALPPYVIAVTPPAPAASRNSSPGSPSLGAPSPIHRVPDEGGAGLAGIGHAAGAFLWQSASALFSFFSGDRNRDRGPMASSLQLDEVRRGHCFRAPRLISVPSIWMR